MPEVRWERYPRASQEPEARSWLTVEANLGLSANTIEAYGRSLEDYLAYCADRRVKPHAATREHVAAYVRELLDRPSPRGANVRVLDSGVGLSNATKKIVLYRRSSV